MKVIATNGYKKNASRRCGTWDGVFLLDRVALIASRLAPTLDLRCPLILWLPKINRGSEPARDEAITDAENVQVKIKKKRPEPVGAFFRGGDLCSVQVSEPRPDAAQPV